MDRVNVLVDELLVRSYHVSYPDDPKTAERAIAGLESAPSRIAMLRSENYPRYQHPLLDAAETVSSRSELDAVLRSIFADWERAPPAQREPEYVSIWAFKICYNILVSKVLPGMQNYNTMILGIYSRRRTQPRPPRRRLLLSLGLSQADTTNANLSRAPLPGCWGYDRILRSHPSHDWTPQSRHQNKRQVVRPGTGITESPVVGSVPAMLPLPTASSLSGPG